jgi:hypothetical protein
MIDTPMIVLSDGGFDGEDTTRVLIEGLLRGLAEFWWLVAIVVLNAVLPTAFSIITWTFRQRRLARSGIKEIDKFGGKKFEEYLEVLFKRLGYSVERTKFVGDFGGDLVVRKDRVRTVVQANATRNRSA